MNNFVQKGHVFDFTVPSGGVVSGDPVAIGSMVGVCVTSGDEDDVVAVNLHGVYTLPKATGAVEVGQKLYLDTTAGDLTTVAEGNVFAGFAWAAALSGAATVLCVLAQGDSQGGAQAANVAELGATSNLVGVDGSGDNAAPLVGTESRLDALDAKVDELIGALVDSGIMADS